MLQRSVCVSPDACPPRADSTTRRMRRAAVEQLRTSGATELRASWQLDSFFDRTFVVSMRSRCLSLAPHTAVPYARAGLICLLGRTDRRYHMQRALAQHGARKVDFFEAIDGRNVSLREPERWRERMMTDEVPVLRQATGMLIALRTRARARDTHKHARVDLIVHVQARSGATSATTGSTRPLAQPGFAPFSC